jgi:hypothetical protein
MFNWFRFIDRKDKTKIYDVLTHLVRNNKLPDYIMFYNKVKKNDVFIKHDKDALYDYQHFRFDYSYPLFELTEKKEPYIVKSTKFGRMFYSKINEPIFVKYRTKLEQSIQEETTIKEAI